MKFIETPDQIVIKESGSSNIAMGVIFTLLGVAGFIYLVMFEDNASPWAAVVMGLFAVIGVAIFFMSKSSETTITRGGDLTIVQKRLLSRKSNRESVPVSQIARVRLLITSSINNDTSSDTTSGSGSRRRTSTLIIVLHDTSEVIVASSSRNAEINGISLNAFMKAPLAEEAQKIAQFLGVQLENNDTNLVQGGLSAMTSAIGQVSQMMQGQGQGQGQSEQPIMHNAQAQEQPTPVQHPTPVLQPAPAEQPIATQPASVQQPITPQPAPTEQPTEQSATEQPPLQ